MKFSVVCSPGIGDLAILHIVSYHLKQAGHDVITVSPHRFGRWLEGYRFGDFEPSDGVYLQYGNNPESEKIRKNKNTYTFFGSYQFAKHGPLKPGYDFVADLNRTMVENVVESLHTLFGINASSENGLKAPEGLVYRRFPKRIAIQTTSGNPFRNWPIEKFKKFAKWAEHEGFEPVFLPQFPYIENLISFIYESGYFLGNDSGPGHIASCLKIPHLIIGREEKHMRHWKPGWGFGVVATPPKWIPNLKGFRLREKYWSSFISDKHVIKTFKKILL